jgi:hypothetical protein
MSRKRVIQKAKKARAPIIPPTPMGATCFAEFEALVVALGGARLSASGVDVVLVVIARVGGVTTVGGVGTVGVGVV